MSDASSVEDSRLLDEVRRSLMGVGRTTMKARSLIITASDVAAGLLARLFGVLTHLLGAPQRHSGSFLKRGEVGRVCPHGGILARRVESKPRLVAPPRATERLRPRRRSPPTSGGAAQAALAGLGERERAGFDGGRRVCADMRTSARSAWPQLRGHSRPGPHGRGERARLRLLVRELEAGLDSCAGARRAWAGDPRAPARGRLSRS